VASKKKQSVSDHLTAIAGLEDDPVYAGGGHGGSAEATSLWGMLEKLDLAGLTGEQLDHLERVLAGGMAAIQEEQLRRIYSVRDWNRNGPDMGRYGGYRMDWIDHPSKLVSKRTGRVYYRSEPYQLGEAGLRRLVTLLDEGWDVYLDAGKSDHFPGRTLAVLVSKREGNGEKK
jgi:hypothetical protein